MKFSGKSVNKESLSRWLGELSRNSLVRWWIVGLFFTFANLPLLYFFDKIVGLPPWLSLSLSSELITILRFFVNDRLVFGHTFPTWRRFWQYHLANAGSFAIWYAASLLLAYGFAVNTVVAGLVGTVFSVGFSMVTNFFWIWRKPPKNRDRPRP